MSSNNSGKFFTFIDGMPPWAKGVAVVGSLGLIAWLTTKIYSATQNSKNAAAANNDVVKGQNDLTALEANGVYPTYVQSDYASYADTLQQAIEGCEFDSANVLSVFGDMKNTADVVSLVQAYGTRPLTPCWAMPISIQNGTLGWLGSELGITSPFSGTLSQALNSEFSDQGHRDDINALLAQNNINYKF